MKTLEEMGLSDDAMFMPKSLSYWEQFPPEIFIAEIMYSVRREVSILGRYIQAINSDEKVTNVSLTDFSDQLTLREACRDALERITRVKDIVTLASLYSTNMEQNKGNQE